ncbi:MAG: hypothetical protein WC710_14465 [Gallionella sp.]|jgi:hypothetical protein
MTTATVQAFINSIPDKRVAVAVSNIFDRISPNNTDTAITAHAGGTQAAAMPLKATAAYHDVTTVATAADSVKLPPAKVGEFHFVKNSAAANAMQVYGSGTDTIDSVATATGVSQLAGDAVLYVCLVPGNYIRLGGVAASEVFTSLTATTISMADGGYIDFSNAAVAAAGSGQSTYAVLADQINAVTGADATVGVALPAASAGRAILVINTSQTATLPVAPINAGNDQINSLTAGTGVFTMGPARAAWFIPTSATQWYVTGDAAIVGTPTEQELDGRLATVTEINRACDVSTRIVNATSSTLTVTEADHDGKTIVLDLAAGIAVTLPVASAGLKFKFIVKTTFTGAATIKSVSGADIMIGHAIMGNDTDNTVVNWQAVAASTIDTIDMLGTANSTGGMAGQIVEIEGLAANLWFVNIIGDAAGTEATPFANTVA